MKKLQVMLIAGAMVFMLSSCGQTKNMEEQTDIVPDILQSSKAAGETNSDETPSAEENRDLSETDGKEDVAYDVLDSLVGEYSYTSADGTGKLMIQKTSDGYDISDYESESSYRFLADSSNIETIEDNKIYIEYPELVLSDDTVHFSYYILEYDMDGIDVYYGMTAPEKAQFLYHAAKQNDKDIQQGEIMDFSYDYSENIKADVDHVVSGSASLQEELENIEKVIQKYTPLAEAAQTQGEMNVSSQWFLVIWDTELNSLWNRFSNSADQQTKDTILAEQRNWIDMKEEATLISIGSSEENGSMYPLLVNSYLEEITKDRAYVIANELAKITGESFVMPDRSAKYGLFVDNYETGSVYSSLVTRQGYSGDDEAVISLYRVGEITGTFVDNGNGELAFTSDGGSIKGIIKINGWDGASFTVTETSEKTIVSVGEEFTFPFVF